MEEEKKSLGMLEVQAHTGMGGWLTNILLGVVAFFAAQMFFQMSSLTTKIEEMGIDKARLEGKVENHEYRLNTHDKEIESLRRDGRTRTSSVN